MPPQTLQQLEFGDPASLDASLSERVRGLVGSEIHKIAAQIREMVAAGTTVCNLTVGDFNTKYFPIPESLRDGVRKALEAGETNYPPSDGMLPLRTAVLEYSAREWGIRSTV